MALNDDGTASTCVILNEDDDASYLPTEASYSPNPLQDPYEYDPVGAELERIIAGDTSTYHNAAAMHSVQINNANQYAKTPLELLAEVDGEQFIPDQLKPSLQNNPTGQPQPVGNYQPANQAVNTVQYHYNGDGHLVGKTVDGVRTDFALDIAGGLPEVIYTSDGNSYLHLPGVIVTENADGDVRYLLSDGLGSIRQAVDESGQVVAYYQFDPYGDPMEGNGGTPYGYTGEWWEDETGLLHLRARWYLPESGTFLSQDPIESEPPYQYAHNNPINRTDPSGKFPPFPPPPPYQYYPPVQPDSDYCAESWPSSGHWRDLCDRAYSGDREAMEEIYRFIANVEGFTHLQNASQALHHFLDGTSTPGDPLYLPWYWYSTPPETQRAYLDLRSQVDDHIKELQNSCDCGNPLKRDVHKDSDPINIDPYYGGIPHDIQATLGAHTLNVDAFLELNDNCVGIVTYDWYAYEYFDFRKWPGNYFEIPFKRWKVPTAWADFLVDDGLAAEYWAAVQHRERKPFTPE